MKYVVFCLMFVMLFDRCLSYSVFFKSIVPNYKKCGDLCVALNDCVSSNYSPTTGECELSRDDDSPSIISHPVFTPLQQTFTSCNTRPCNQGEVCINIAAGQAHICLTHRDAIPCDPPTQTPGTEVSSWVTAMFHLEAVYTCAPGYTYMGGSGKCTCSDTYWTQPDIQCLAIDCGQPDDIPNMILSLDITTYGSTATYVCDVGYNGTGSGVITCQLSGTSGQWSSPSLSCHIVECGQAPDVADMTATVEATTYESTATYSCDVGYSGTGSGEVTCQDTGMWSSPALTCLIVDCGQPGSITNMVATPGETTYNATASYACDVGYNPTGSGSGSVTCQETGLWTVPQLSCQIMDCGQPTAVENMTVSVEATTFASTATYSCDVGYNGTGSGEVTCQDTGMWTSPTFSCQLVDCGQAPPVTNMAVSAETTTYGSTSIYSCDVGYTPLQGSGEVTCQETGLWTSATLQCNIVDCGQPTSPLLFGVPSLVSMVVTADETTYGSIATWGCLLGYTAAAGSGDVTCQAKGEWETPSLTCNIVDCGEPDGELLPNQTLTVSATTYESTAEYSCDVGFSARGEGTVTCTETGDWTSHTLTCQLVDCGVPTSALSWTDNLQGYDNTTYGSQATYICALGYQQSQAGSGVGISTCEAGGAWSHPTLSCTTITMLTDSDISGGTSDSLVCSNKISGPSAVHDDAETTVGCEATEILTNCAYLLDNMEGDSDGAKVTTSGGKSVCTAVNSYKTTAGTRAHARCCSMKGFECEYLQMNPSGNLNDDTTTRVCKEGFQVVGCAVQSYYGLIDGMTLTDNGCVAHNAGYEFNEGIYGFTICCGAWNLNCTRVESEPTGLNLDDSVSVTCPADYTMTSCMAYSAAYGIRGTEIVEEAGVSRCVAYNGRQRTEHTPRAIAGCCKVDN